MLLRQAAKSMTDGWLGRAPWAELMLNQCASDCGQDGSPTHDLVASTSFFLFLKRG